MKKVDIPAGLISGGKSYKLTTEEMFYPDIKPPKPSKSKPKEYVMPVRIVGGKKNV